MSDIIDYHTCDTPIEWKGMYEQDGKYKRYRDPSTNAHPAKMPVALVVKIIDHLNELGMIDKDSRIIDFMAGSGTTGIAAELCGHEFIGVELEDHFIEMIKRNATAMQNNIGREPKWTIIEGDARELTNIISNGVGITSPPYADTGLRYARNGIIVNGKKYYRPYMNGMDGYSHYAGNIGNLKDAGIVSPPYINAIGQSGGPLKSGFKIGISQINSRRYSYSTENVGNMKDIGIVSPPYGLGKGLGHDGQDNGVREKVYTRYSDNDDNIGNKVGESYQSAMMRVYSEAYKSGISPLVVVTKNPTKNKQIRRLDLDTVALLQMAGYTIADYHRAILWEEQIVTNLDGEEVKKVKGRMSFFKRLQYQKGLPVAQWEDIILAVN